MLHVNIIKIEPDLNCLPEDTIHVSDFGADNLKVSLRMTYQKPYISQHSATFQDLNLCTEVGCIYFYTNNVTSIQQKLWVFHHIYSFVP